MGIVQELKPNFPDSQQSQPWSIIKFYTFVGKDTLYNTGARVSPNNLASIVKVVETVVVSDILSLKTNSSKGNPLATAEVTLASGDLNYQSLLSPGDHALIWMGSDRADFDRIGGLIFKQNKPANDFASGLKFVGRVNSIRTIYNTSPDGIKTIRYHVTFKGFSEFMTSLYYNYALAPNSPQNQGNAEMQKMNKLYGEISKQWNSYFFSKDKNKSNVQSIMDFLIDVFLGSGPSDSARKANKAVKSPNSAFLIPKELMDVLGITNKNSTPNYANMLHTMVGVQNYGNSFLPNISASESISTQKVTTKKLSGTLTTPPDLFNNTPLWSALQSVCNPVLNEIYTTLRVNEANRIVPFFIGRQIPFTSIYSQEKGGGARFIDIPRWKVDTALAINSLNIGTSDSARFNFFQVYGNLFGLNSTRPGFSQQAQIAAGNFSINEVDIYRHGSRNMIQNVLTDFSSSIDNTIQIRGFAALLKDWYGNAHLKFSGSINTAGVQAPICIGDNMEIGGKLFHIESVNHFYEVVDGEKAFKTFTSSFDLSQGVLSDGSYGFNEAVDRAKLNPDGKGLEPGFSDEELRLGDILKANAEGNKSNV